jgi:CheY-like chemotaxis protein
MSVIRENLPQFRERLAALTERIAKGGTPNEKKEADSADGKNSTIMVVDDNIANLKIAKIALSEFYNVYTVTSVTKMFDLLTRHKPEFILFDIDMPEMDGYEAIKILKANPDTRDIPVIFLTGTSSPEDELNWLSLGVVGCISKPFMPQLLREKVKLYVTAAARNKKIEALSP